eukprot:310845-Rhodomonas_salina.1
MTETARGRSRRPSPSGPLSSLLSPPPFLPPPRHRPPAASPLHLTAPHSLCLQSPSAAALPPTQSPEAPPRKLTADP